MDSDDNQDNNPKSKVNQDINPNPNINQNVNPSVAATSATRGAAGRRATKGKAMSLIIIQILTQILILISTKILFLIGILVKLEGVINVIL